MRHSLPPTEEKATLRFLWTRIIEHRKWIIFSFLFGSCATFVQIQTAQLVKRFMDDAFIPRDGRRLVILCATLFGLFVFDGITDFLHRYCLRIATERAIRRLRREMFDRFLTLSQEQAAQSTSGKALTYILSDTFVIGQGLHVVADLFREPLVLLGLMGYLFYRNWALTLICVTAVPIIMFIGRGLGRSARRNQTRIQGTLDTITGHINESLGGLRTAHSFGQTPRLREEFRDQTEESYRWLIRLARTEEIVSPLTKIFTSGIGACLILVAGWFVTTNRMTPGDALAFITAAGMIQQPLRQLNQVNVRLQQVLASGHRLFLALSSPLDPISRAQGDILQRPDPRSPRPASSPAPTLALHGVSYRYPKGAEEDGPRDFAVRDIELVVRPGSRIALVGKSGAGKSTLSLLAMRFVDPTQGRVLLNDRDARDWELSAYRAHFAYVSQEVALFGRSLRDNLRFAREDATDEEILLALERASIREFVEKLPRGLDTNIAEHAANLSGGERQRLAIARAFLKDAPILVLDEATSQLDALSEAAIRRALEELMKNRTTLIIAHRLATVRGTDEVAVFQNGEIIERGAPNALLENSQSHFARLWSAQATDSA
jgi:subfamily B ATP-binding cassette protein MsbA